jgi:hypothetical protein
MPSTIPLIGLNYFSDAVRDAFDPRRINSGRYAGGEALIGAIQ